MQYNGGKVNIGKRWASLIAPKGCLFYWEPFCGMLGVGRHIKAAGRLFSDLDPAVISFLSALKGGWLPPKELSEDQYNQIRKEGNCYDPLYAFAAYGCSFAGKRWGGYARSSERNYALNAFNAAVKLQSKLRTTDVFQACSYVTPLRLHKDMIIYCDPLYSGTTSAGVDWSFKCPEFIGWCNRIAPQVKALYVSEFKQLASNWQLIDSVDQSDGLKATTERLYRVIPTP